MPGLRIYRNELPGGQPGAENHQFDDDSPGISNLLGSRIPASVSGTPWSDVITFSIPRFLWQDVSQWWASAFTTGVLQQRLITGEIVLTPAKYPCQMCRACWDVRDKRTGALLQETATGLFVVTQAEVAFDAENWQLTLYRGDYYLNQFGELEASTRGCGGN